MNTNDGLALMRSPFPLNQISKLPKGTKAQNDCPANEKVNCKVCGGWHHPKIIHLDYVGHAALTDRLLDADPLWTWEPLALKDGLPAFDESGGLWIKLTVCGVSRICYGHAAHSAYKDIGSREKEVIGDALRNSAMRFGAALDLWHKGELHINTPDNPPNPPPPPPTLPPYDQAQFDKNFPKWLEVIASGKLTADDIIVKASTKGTLTQQQREAIMDCAPKPEQPKNEWTEAYEQQEKNHEDA